MDCIIDAGIVLKPDWLEKLAAKAIEDVKVDIVYGNYTPVVGNYFERIATLVYVPALTANSIRGKSIASYFNA